MKYKVLAADDEMELLDALELFMEKEQIELMKAGDGIAAMSLFESGSPHLVLLDIMMPGLDGFSVLRKIRETSKVPVIMVTAKGADYDKILGLELGADDYITKPYNPMEVVARIKAALRRNYDYREETDKEPMELSMFTLTLNEVEGTVKKRDEFLELTRTEYMILRLFMHNPGRIFTKQQIFEHVWEEQGYMADDNTVMVHISNLRGKIEDNPKTPAMLKTIKGLGYKFEKEK
ncbi:MAG: response regulator transcription factor [Lachnospiraceae bacterium]|nr:response regulator transcription factor [Lachnospiraceae bacterium]